jgi:pSer/pThr/pTyr-binding forkhead associated (FHA) protein
MRPLPAHRKRVIRWLCRAHARDVLGLETLEWRMERASLVSTVAELRALVADLPALRVGERLARAWEWLRGRDDEPEPQLLRMFVSLPARPGAPVVVGRSRGCDVRVIDDTVSRRHLVLEKADARWLVRDLGSTNGTFLEGREITQAVIVPGQFVDLGNTRLCVTFPRGAG